MNDTELTKIVNNLIVDKHIKTTCTDFVSTCYNLFYNEDELDVTFNLGLNEYTIPNLAKNTESDPEEGIVDPEGAVIGKFGQFYYNQINQKIFFKSTEEEDSLGWVMLFQRTTNTTEEDALDNINDLLSTAQGVITNYYNIFYTDTPMDVTLKMYNSEGVLEDVTIPNRAKSMKQGITGEGTPEGSVEGTAGSFYVNTLTHLVYAKATTSGNTGWYELIGAEDLTAHNLSPSAHQGYLARIEGDRTRTFNVGDPTTSNHAVNLKYTGALSDLTTIDKSNLVNAINEVNDGLNQVEKQTSLAANVPPWCAISGYVDTYGQADLIQRPSEIVANSTVMYEDVTTEAYIDNTNNGRWKDDFGSITNFYSWGNEGGVFGWPVNSGFHGWSKVNNLDTTPNQGNVGYLGNPIVHEFDTLGPGVYELAFGYSDFAYKVSVVRDGESTLDFEPLNLEKDGWVYSNTFTVNTAITELRAEGLAESGEWGIGPIRLIKIVTLTSTTPDKIYFKTGANYGSVQLADVSSNIVTKDVLKTIDLGDYTGVSNKSYYVMVNQSKYNHNRFNLNGAVEVDEDGYADRFFYNNIKGSVTVNTGMSVEASEGITVKIRYKTQSSARNTTAMIFADDVTGMTISELNGSIYVIHTAVDGGNVATAEVNTDTDYDIEVRITETQITAYIDGTEIGHASPTTTFPTYSPTTFYLGNSSGDNNYTLGGIYLNTFYVKAGNKVYVDGSSTDPYLYEYAITRSKTTPANTGIWKNVSVYPIQIIETTTGKPFKDIPIGIVTINAGTITWAKTLPYCNREVDTPTSVSPAYIVETNTYTVSGAQSYYRLWSNGFCEQGGWYGASTSGNTITLVKPYTSTYYTISLAPSAGTSTVTAVYEGSFTVGNSANNTMRWYTSGFVNM